MNPIFLTGVARGGTTLLANILGLASDPYLPLFQLLRKAILREAGLPCSGPIPDYYFGDLEALDAIQDGDLDVAVSEHELRATRLALADRMGHESPALVPLIDKIEGSTCREVFDSALSIAPGIKDVWVVEFFGPLHRAYPDAKFVLIVRDPRAVILSALRIGGIHPLSYARQWRKSIAFAQRYDWLHVIRYEDLVDDPWTTLEPFGALPDPADIDPEPATAWKKRFNSNLDVLAMVEMVCGPEMRLMGYEPMGARADVLGHLLDSDRWDLTWRSDSGEPRREYWNEIRRKRQAFEAWEEHMRSGFLFKEAHTALQACLSSV